MWTVEKTKAALEKNRVMSGWKHTEIPKIPVDESERSTVENEWHTEGVWFVRI